MVNHDYDRSAFAKVGNSESDSRYAGATPAPPRESLLSRIESTAGDAAEVAVRATTLAGRLAGYYPPKDDGAKTQIMPDNSAARIDYANDVIRRSGADIMRALSAIEDALS